MLNPPIMKHIQGLQMTVHNVEDTRQKSVQLLSREHSIPS